MNIKHCIGQISVICELEMQENFDFWLKKIQIFKKKVVLGLYVHSFFLDENVGGPRYKKKIGTVRKPECLLYPHTSDFIF